MTRKLKRISSRDSQALLRFSDLFKELFLNPNLLRSSSACPLSSKQHWFHWTLLTCSCHHLPRLPPPCIRVHTSTHMCVHTHTWSGRPRGHRGPEAGTAPGSLVCSHCLQSEQRNEPMNDKWPGHRVTHCSSWKRPKKTSNPMSLFYSWRRHAESCNVSPHAQTLPLAGESQVWVLSSSHGRLFCSL